jgi:N-acetylmuramoyl-L-alanine amidase
VAVLSTLGRMRLRFFLLISAVAGAMLGIPAAASAYFVHVVSQGESLSSIAAQDGLSVDALAAANGLSPDTQLLAGSTIQIPPQGTTAVTPVSAASATGGTAGDGDADSDDTGAGTAVPASTSTSGSYVVQPGDTLSALAARSGVSVDALAAANGLDPNAYLVTGTVLHLAGSSSATGTMVPVSDTTTTSTGASYVVQGGDTLSAIAARSGVSVDALAAANGLNPDHALLAGTVLRVSAGSGTAASGDAATSQPVGTNAQGTPTDPPYPTPERVSSSEVGSIASANGVPAPLADAIGWQESGFNNDLVSSADARGVMQILPGTWAWIQQSLNDGPPLAPASAADNVRGGVLLLHSLLNSTGGDASLAAAGYYQGLPSVEQNGVYPSTQQYVNSVLALERQFGGGG